MPTVGTGTGDDTPSPGCTGRGKSSGLAVSRTGDEISKVPAGVSRLDGGAGGAEGSLAVAVGVCQSWVRLSFFFELFDYLNTGNFGFISAQIINDNIICIFFSSKVN